MVGKVEHDIENRGRIAWNGSVIGTHGLGRPVGTPKGKPVACGAGARVLTGNRTSWNSCSPSAARAGSTASVSGRGTKGSCSSGEASVVGCDGLPAHSLPSAHSRLSATTTYNVKLCRCTL